MLSKKRIITELNKNGALWFNTEILYIEPGFEHLYQHKLIDSEGRPFIKLKCEKFFDNGQFAWKLEWNEKGELLNRHDKQFRKDGTIVQI